MNPTQGTWCGGGRVGLTGRFDRFNFVQKHQRLRVHLQTPVSIERDKNSNLLLVKISFRGLVLAFHGLVFGYQALVLAVPSLGTENTRCVGTEKHDMKTV